MWSRLLCPADVAMAGGRAGALNAITAMGIVAVTTSSANRPASSLDIAFLDMAPSSFARRCGGSCGAADERGLTGPQAGRWSGGATAGLRLWHLDDLSRTRDMAADPRRGGAMQPHHRAAGDGNIRILARREVDCGAAVKPRADLLGHQPAQVGAARSRSLERHFTDLAARGDAAAAVRGDVQCVLLEVGQLEFTGAVQRPGRNRGAGKLHHQAVRRVTVVEGVGFERVIAQSHVVDLLGIAADARLRLRSGLVMHPHRNPDLDDVAAAPSEIDRAWLARAGFCRRCRRAASPRRRPGSIVAVDEARCISPNSHQRAQRRNAQ